MGIGNVFLFIRKDIKDWFDGVDSPNYTDRLSRSSFCLRYIIFHFICTLVLWNIYEYLNFSELLNFFNFSTCSNLMCYIGRGWMVLVTFSIVVFILMVYLNMIARRVHDFGGDAVVVFYFLVLIEIGVPIFVEWLSINNEIISLLFAHLIVLSIFCLWRSDPNPNQYGDPP